MELVRSHSTLTLAAARLAVDAAVAEAERLGVRMNVAVTDPGGALLAFARMDGAFTASADIAIDKARTVVSFGGTATDALYSALSGEDAVIRGIGNRPGVAAFGGGVPVTIAGEVVGAVGASGGSAEEDRTVADAGRAAVEDA